MRVMTFLLLIILSIPVFSRGRLTCFNGGKIIYMEDGKNLSYEDGLFSITESKTGHAVFIRSDCIIKLQI